MPLRLLARCRIWEIVLMAAVVMLPGCGSTQPDNIVHLKGNVTFRGKPLPAGMIVFEPNPAKGNRGPQGHADVKEGKFDTRDSQKGAVKGPMIVRITGGDGVNPEPFTPFGQLLFEEYSTDIDVADNPKELDIEVPAVRTKSGGK